VFSFGKDSLVLDGFLFREMGNNEGGRERKFSYDRGECL
jgi:hypothetical protein